MSMQIGDLVECDAMFSGIGKLLSLNEISKRGMVGFFESPMRPHSRKIEVVLADLRPGVLFDEAVVFVVDEATTVWRRARYGSQRPNGDHLVIYSHDDMAVVPASEIYVVNTSPESGLQPAEFLAARCCDTPLFTEWRIPFLRAYLEQRAACRSISSILSSSVEIEPHQVAVVRRVLEDDTQRYLLADEVGLGKTIEACLIIREHVLQDQDDALVLIAVPRSLVDQWRAELANRFYLGDLLDNQIFVCSHEKLAGALRVAVPTMIVIDEAHLVAPWAWSELQEQRSEFLQIATASSAAENCLLLSGTPLSGNETNFLAMLHLLAPESYHLTKVGIDAFKHRVLERERLGGMYQALIATNDNESLTDIVDTVAAMFPDDGQLSTLIATARPLIAWSTPEFGDERAAAVRGLRLHLGETYRLHHRMLRNRREDPEIAGLFPGLAGAVIIRWTVDERNLSIDQILDAYRDEHINSSDDTFAIATVGLTEWLELYLCGPGLVSKRAIELLASGAGGPLDLAGMLKELAHCGQLEQRAKDAALLDNLTEWMARAPRMKAVVFCGDPVQADEVASLLRIAFGDSVERHNPDVTPRFQFDADVRMLVCDWRGEDGLNLHGGEKLIVHYSLPLSFAKIEQRNGRVNRYSAGIRARPVRGIVLCPDRQGFFTRWIALLNDAVQIFDRSVASLQFVLQEQIDITLRRIPFEGVGPLDELRALMMGQNGLLDVEQRRISAQEQLQSMNEEVQRAKQFAEELRAADEVAEAQSQKMLRWLCKGLKFEKVPGPVPNSYRFRFNTGDRGGRTLVDVRSFIASCVTGVDKGESDWSSPVTSLMSPDRELVTHGRQVYPLRFGQPFVDTIYDLSRVDPRGITCAWLRAVESQRITAPQIFFSLSWIVDGCPNGSARRDQRLADERLKPMFVSHWLAETGDVVEASWLMDLLASQFSTSQARSKEGVNYKDVRIRHDTWASLEEFFPKANWADMVARISAQSRDLAVATAAQGSSIFGGTVYGHPQSISTVILLGNLT